MMGDDNGIGILAPIIFIIGVVIGSVCGIMYERSYWHEQAVERGYAEHNRQTGDWQWIDYEYKARILEETAP